MSSALRHALGDHQSLSFEQRVQRGAENAERCMDVTAQDRVFIMTVDERESIACHVADAVLAQHADVIVRLLEHYGARPMTHMPAELHTDLLQSHPTVTYYIASAQPGEITFRLALRSLLVQELKARHGHMLGITGAPMADGMCADYDEVFRLTNQVHDLVRRARTIHVTSVKGSDVTATFHPDWKWVACHGRYYEQGTWGNLPEGEVFTTPATVDGVLVCDLLDDYFSEKYGLLKHPLTIKVQNSYVTEVTSEDHALAQEVVSYLFSTSNGNRVGEFAIGTLLGLKKLVGNLAQDEKMPGLHVAFGHPYPQFTGADWDAPIHVDVIPSNCTIEVDGCIILRNGTFTLEKGNRR